MVDTTQSELNGFAEKTNNEKIYSAIS